MSGDSYRVRVFPLFEDLGGLTASPGLVCAVAEDAGLDQAMVKAGREAAAWLDAMDADGEPRPCGFDVRVEVPN